MSRVPRIRFKGFEEDWEQRKLGEIGTTYSGLSGKTKDDFGHGQASFITYMNVYSNPVSRCDMVEPIEIDNRQNEVEIGDVFFTTSSETPEEVGMTSVLTEKRGIIYLNSFCFGFRPFEKIDKYYLAYMLRSKNTREKIILLAQGISRYNISKNKVMEIPVEVPSFDEQIRIGKKFHLIDHLITLHQRKLEKLKIIKKSMLENLFPQNGEKTPKIRFSGFTKDWEQRKLGEVCNIITKQTGFDYSSTIKPALLKEKADNTYPFIQNKDFNGTTINMDTDFFIPIIVAEKFPNIVLDRPSILISISGRIGNVGFYSCVNKAFIGGAVGICKLKYNDDGKFIIHELESEYGQKYFYSLIKASSHANITIEDIRNMELIFPEKKEEKICISTFFSSFNHLITLHQSKLEKLQKIKKSMLESMFV